MHGKSHRGVGTILIAMCVVCVGGLVCCCAGFIRHIIKSEMDRTQQYMVDITQKSAVAVNNKIDGYLSTLRALASAISRYPENKELNAEIMRHQLELREFRRIGCVYENGDTYSVDNELGELSGVDFRTRGYYRAAMRGISHVEAPFDDYWTENRVVLLSVPIYSHEGGVMGVLCGVNNADAFTRALEKSYTMDGAYFHIIDSAGNMLFRSSYANAELFSANIFTAEYEYFEGLERLRENVSAGLSGTATFKEYGESEKYVAYVPLQTNDWYIASIIPTELATRHTRSIMGYTATLMIILSATVALLIVTFAESHRKDSMEKYDLAFYDALTGCCKKVKFIIDLAEYKNLYDGQHYILVYDIRNFRNFNQIFGYGSGDELITALSRILRENIGSGEQLARLYAERFVLLVSARQARALNCRIEATFEAVDSHMRKGDKSNYKLISRCGIYRIQPMDGNGSPDAFIDYANQARMSLQDIYRSSYHYFNAEEYTRNSEKTRLESRMHTALANREFILYLQPKYAILDRRPVLCGAESLVRWNFNGEKLICPDQFIPDFEQNGFIAELDMYMLEESCALLRKWLDRGGACVPLAVNQSRVNMYNASYLSRILEITGRYRIPHELLDFEITESAMTNDAGQVREQFRQLRALGFSTSVDDFGNGFSSLSTLRDIEADTIKIDRYFFNEAFDSPEGKYTVEAIISLVKGLRYRVIAEGIETAEQVEFLRHCECDGVQGYYFGKPQPVEAFERGHLYRDEGDGK